MSCSYQTWYLCVSPVKLELSSKAQDYLIDIGYDPVYGVRPIKRAIQHELEHAMTTKLLETAFVEGDTIVIDCVDNALTFSKKKPLNLPQPQTVV